MNLAANVQARSLKPQEWVELFEFVREKSQNQKNLAEFIFEYFTTHPQEFYQFILAFRHELQHASDQAIRERLAHQYLAILSSLVERFGFFKEKSLLDDLCFEITDTKHYKEIDAFLLKYKKQKGKILRQIAKILTAYLEEAGYSFEIKARYKTFYSIYQKLKKKRHKNVLRVKDIFGFRIILNDFEGKKCYEIADLLHDRFYPIPDYFKDYIAIPRINGYQSLHTGISEVISNLSIPIEVQIRTKQMDEYAEKGIAAHWIYAKDKKAYALIDPQKIWEGLYGTPSKAGASQNVYFFSYKGDIFKLEYGATILDFAYSLHTDLGDHTISALVNENSVPLDYTIQQWDLIRILESKERQVRAKWVNQVKTSYAKKKIQESLKHHSLITTSKI